MKNIGSRKKKDESWRKKGKERKQERWEDQKKWEWRWKDRKGGDLGTNDRTKDESVERVRREERGGWMGGAERKNKGEKTIQERITET